MSIGANHLERAINAANAAAEEDKKENWKGAYEGYLRALELFQLALKYERNKGFKEKIAVKAQEILARAEAIKPLTQSGAQESDGTSDGASKPGDTDAIPTTKPGAGAAAPPDESKDSDKEDDTDPEVKKMREAMAGVVLSEKPNVRWTDIAGLEPAKAALKEAVILPVKFPHLFTGKRTPWRGILLFGPPGTGKTYIAKAVATEAESAFLSVSSSDLVSKWMGESERLIKQLFSTARSIRPAIIFIDEIDSLCGARGEGESEASRRIKTEFLVQMQGVGNDTKGILVLAATNTPWALDPALRRRFERRIYIPLPDVEARTAMFKIHVGDTPNELREEDYGKLALMTEGYSGSDIGSVVRDALFEPVRKVQYATHFKHVMAPLKGDRAQMVKHITPCSPSDPAAFEMVWTEIPVNDKLYVPPVNFRDFVWALSKTKKSVGPEDITRQEHWMREL
ncbi:AAA-domain-containing protein [Gonapodya prolifera JEL478]|uniref:AAA-domain-containing protein n=1 Tax=Gonapodya prolifera (strain JEL478) TaxID=1344416 RepID=A0A139APR7_GONPJ|nr:AAA-domain-containing protein [Gonapodya prolifera JEL478]|eukprot:KXS18485.1 AAA-domain-containing protein [Gonapodya prolifera JEL478]